MKTTKLKIQNLNTNYSIIIGRNILNQISNQIKILCPGAQKIALVVDKNVPTKFKIKLRNYLRKYKVYTFQYDVNEKFKSFINVNKLVEKCLEYNFNRNDILISMGGGILGDYSAFAASIIKRGINFINVPTTLLAQVDSSIGGKTGVNSKYGKNLIGSFYQPKLVISDIEILKSLPHK
jgi:3-dehydroquinate synthase